MYDLVQFVSIYLTLLASCLRVAVIFLKLGSGIYISLSLNAYT
jgi:hypothetical protein